MAPEGNFRSPSLVEQTFNRAFGFFVGLGLGPSFGYLLQVRGRKSGKLYSTPVSLVELNQNKYLVAPRGRTQWVRNAEATGGIALKRGRKLQRFRLRPLAGTEKLQVLSTYLDSYRRAVQRFFPIPAGSPASAFESVAASYPAFELLPIAPPN
jgi:deazaflavin-dependent oxidoreductase (nitroreductase family)